MFVDMNLKQAEGDLKATLLSIYPEGEAGAIAALAMEWISGIERGKMISAGTADLTDEQERMLISARKRLLDHEPVQYVSNTAWFYNLRFYVNTSVLIPRSETEELVHWIISDLSKTDQELFSNDQTTADQTRSMKIMDVGTGSGCIAIALKHSVKKAEAWGCDKSPDALSVARRNAAELDVRVDFQQVDFLDIAEQMQLPSADIIVSNPPYIPKSDAGTMSKNVIEFEPQQALFVEDDAPLVFYDALITFSREKLQPNGRIYVELHEDLSNEVDALFRSAGFFTECRKDMQGKFRMLKAWT